MRSPTPTDQRYVHFVTFGCYKRREILKFDDAKRIVLGTLNACLKQFDAYCLGFVLMPNHVHLMVWFPEVGQLGEFLREWKRISSFAIKERITKQGWKYFEKVPPEDPIWQANFYSFEIYDEKKIEEKLAYMHLNPVRAGLVQFPWEWQWSSARWYELGRSVGVPIRIPEL